MGYEWTIQEEPIYVVNKLEKLPNPNGNLDLKNKIICVFSGIITVNIEKMMTESC